LTTPLSQLAATGIAGLDDILRGGLPRRRIYLLQGSPGTGKTTLGLQFLLEGERRGEPGLYVTLSETEEELRAVATSHGWSLDGIALHQLSSLEDVLAAQSQNTLFHPSEVELNETTSRVLELVEKARPVRVVFDSLSEMRLLAGDSLRYRRQILSLKQYFAGRNSTVLFLDDGTAEHGDLQLHSLAHGVISLEKRTPDFGATRRWLEVAKLRGVPFRSGRHDCSIERGGLRVFPRLIAAEHHTDFERGKLSSGVADLDALLGGGLDRGTSTLLLGPAGSGKSTLAAQFVHAAAAREERTAMFSFDENLGTLFARTSGMGLALEPAVQQGWVSVKQVDPAELSPGEFAHGIREAVEQDGARVVVIDSLNGYLMAMPDEHHLVTQLHEVLSYLNQRGVTTLLVLAQHGLVGTMEAPVDITYLADTVTLLRYFEAEGQVRKALSVLKKRTGFHEDTIREFQTSPNGIVVGPPLRGFRGILTGVPELTGEAPHLLGEPRT
jgi:circadian clock protein KaiC